MEHPTLSKVEGKKRQVKEDEDVTATDRANLADSCKKKNEMTIGMHSDTLQCI